MDVQGQSKQQKSVHTLQNMHTTTWSMHLVISNDHFPGTDKPGLVLVSHLLLPGISSTPVSYLNTPSFHPDRHRVLLSNKAVAVLYATSTRRNPKFIFRNNQLIPHYVSFQEANHLNSAVFVLRSATAFLKGFQIGCNQRSLSF